MGKAFTKDILRTIRKERKRLIALTLITALGVTMLTGLRAACDDLRHSADAFFDQQSLHDLSVVSTLGLTEEDVDALEQIPGVLAAEGAYTELVRVDVPGGTSGAIITTFQKRGLDVPYPLEGRLPRAEDEIAVTSNYLKDTGKQIGDTLTIYEDLPEKEEPEETEPSEASADSSIPSDLSALADAFPMTDGSFDLTALTSSDDETPNFPVTTYTITGVVADVTSIVNPEGTTASFRSSSDGSYPLFVLRKAVDTDLYTSINLLVEGAAELDTFSDEYRDLVLDVRERIEDDIKKDRERARSLMIQQQAESALDDVGAQVDSAFAAVDQEMENARTELNRGWGQINSGYTQIDAQEAAAAQQFKDAKAEIQAKYAELAAGTAQLDAAQAQIDTTRAQLDTYLGDILVLAEQARNYLNSIPEDSELYGPAQLALAELDNQLAALQAQYGQLDAAQAEIDSNRAQITQGYAALQAAEAQLAAAETEAASQLAAARAQLDAGRSALYRGEAEYSSGLDEVASQKSSAALQLEIARLALSGLDTATWYVRDRSNLDGYSNIVSDAGCIESIGTMFPVMFFLIAILISLTTITRMVEENRSLIGTYQALGFSSREILRKYLAYAAVACLCGGLLGNLLGFVILPEILFIIFREMYLIPHYILTFLPLYGFGGVLLFCAGILGATYISCRTELRHMPAILMRPKAPGSGSRIFLEYLRPVWKHMSFLNKVTARNLFRYKKRFLMTVFGIAGCTGLLLCGLTIKDTVADLMPRQYDEIFAWDLLAVTGNGDDLDALCGELDEDGYVAEYIPLLVQPVQVSFFDESMTMQMYVFPDGVSPEGYFDLDTDRGEDLLLEDDGLYITENAAVLMGFELDDTIEFQTLQLDTAEGPVMELVQNYLGNAIYATEAFYTEEVGSFEPNALLIHLFDREDVYDEQENLIAIDGVLSVSSIQEMKDGFQNAFALMNMVVYVVILMAAALAFVVLYTLATTNISERERELATIKVLGFYDREVHHYVNKESFLLSLLGIALGVPFGKLIGFFLIRSLRIPSVFFIPSLHPISYVYAVVMSVIFTLLVELMTNRILNRIDPIEALKSVE